MVVLLAATFVGLGTAQTVASAVGSPTATVISAAPETVDPPSGLLSGIQLAPQPERAAGLSPLWVVISASLAGAVLMTALLSHRRS